MINEKIGNVAIERFDDIDELVVTNYNLFNQYALLDAEIASDMPGIERHFKNLDFHLARKQFDEAIQCRKNQHQAFYHLFNGTNFPALQWAAMLRSVDGKRLEDYSMDTLKLHLDLLSREGLTMAKIKADILAAKKKYRLK